MRSKSSIAVAAVALLLVAGCAGLPVRPPQAASSAAADGWADPRPAMPDALPPGVTESDVESETLLSAHRESLADTGFVVTRTASSPAGNGSVRARVTADRSRAFLRYDTTGPDRQVFLNGDRMAVRTTNGNETRVRRTARTQDASAVPDDFAFDGRVRTYLERVAHEPVGTVERDGRTLVVLEANASDIDGELVADGEVTSLRSQALVAPNGTVVSHRAVLSVADAGGESVRYEHRYDVTVGPVEIERPPWATAE